MPLKPKTTQMKIVYFKAEQAQALSLLSEYGNMKLMTGVGS